MGLQGFERRLERLVEGTFNKAFRSGLAARRDRHRLVTRVLDNGRTLGVSGRPVAPNNIGVYLSPDDFERFELVRRRARPRARRSRPSARPRRGLPVPRARHRHARVRRLAEAGRRSTSSAEIAEGAGGQVGSLVLPDGRRVRLGEHPTVLGRNSDCTVPLADPRASRRHAEIRATADGFLVVDLGLDERHEGQRRPGARARAARRRRDRGRRDGDALRGFVVPESVLTILKFCFLALLYLFLFRVVRVVMAEMRAPAPAPPQPTAGRRRPRRAERPARGRGSGAPPHPRAGDPTRRDVHRAGRAHRRSGRRVAASCSRRHLRVTGARARLPARRRRLRRGSRLAERHAAQRPTRRQPRNASAGATRCSSVRPSPRSRRRHGGHMRLVDRRGAPMSVVCATATRTATSSTRRWVSSPSPTAWAATAPARSRARPRSRRSARRSTAAIRCARRSRTANEAVFTKSLTDDDYQGMGTTLTAATLASGGTLIVGPRRRLPRLPAARRRASGRSPSTTAWCRSWSTTGGSPPRTPRCTRCATIITRSLGIGAHASTSTCTRWSSCPAIASCSAPTASPTCCTTTSSAPSCGATTIPRAPRPAWSTRRTAPAVSTTSPSSSSSVTDEEPVRGDCARTVGARRRLVDEPPTDAGEPVKAVASAAKDGGSGARCSGSSRCCSSSPSGSARSAGTRATTTSWPRTSAV